MITYEIGYVSMLKNDICDPARGVEDWPIEQIFTNTQLDTGNADTKFFLSNATGIEECVQQCCEAEADCNLVLFVEMKMCYLIGCKSDQDCILKPNHKKLTSDPLDYIIKIRSSSSEVKQVAAAADGQKKSNCMFNSTSSGCPLNELCLLDDCVCPNELSYVRIEGVCREYLKHKSVGCSLFMSECDPSLNEECISLSSMNRHGTCQCKVGYKRNMDTALCELFQMKYVENKSSNKRKRPDLKINNDIDTFDEILEALGVEPEKVLSEPGKPVKTNLKPNTVNKTVSISTIKTVSSSVNTSTVPTTHTKKSTSPATTTTTTTREVFVEPTRVNTKNLIAFAGNDIHVFYPNTMVVLDGSLTRFYGTDGNQGIVRWLWSKHDSSPAFGRFHQSNEKPIVVYEQLVEGVYRFILKIWSNSNEFSQDVVHVYVHSHLNSSKSISSSSSSNTMDHTNHQELINKEFINENIVQIELDIEPKLFTESVKNSFINKLTILMQQSELKSPKLLLVNSKVSFKSTKSRVILEVIACEDSSTQQPNEDTFDYEYLIKLSQDSIRADKMGVVSRRVLRSTELIKILKTNNKIYSVKSLIGSLLGSNSDNLAINYLGMRITEIGQLTCDYSHNDTCSSHGTCDSLTGKCVCSAYWMPNLFGFYLQNESDLTNGNNCEWSVPLFIAFLIILFIVFTLIAGYIFKYIVYFFFYILCCCCCCCCAKKKVNRYEDFKKNKMKKYGKFDQYLEEKLNKEQDSDEENDYNENHKRTTLSKLTSKFRSVPVLNGKKKAHKYALLDADDESRIMKKSRNDRMGAKLNMENVASTRNLNDEEDDDEEQEDVVFEQSYTTEKNKHKQSNSVKANGHVKEYKEIV